MQPERTDGDMFCAGCAEPTLLTECCGQCGCCVACCECSNCGCERCSKIRAAAVAELRTIAAARRADGLGGQGSSSQSVDLADESIDQTVTWAAGTLKAIADQVAAGATAGEMSAAAYLAGQVTTVRRAQILLVMFGHCLAALEHAAELAVTDRYSLPVVDLARDCFEYHQGAALAEIALDGS